MKPMTIGIRGTGPGTGKDTATEMLLSLLDERGMTFSHKKFATALREVAEILTGVPVSVSETTEGKNIIIESMGITMGRFLQTLGSQMIKENTYPNVWVDALFRRLNPSERVVISDVRFPNEQNAVKQRNGVVILIDSNRTIDVTALAGRSITHDTERALDGIAPDYIIKNDGTLDELHGKLKSLVAMLFG